MSHIPKPSEVTCRQCGFIWRPRSVGEPARCPRCDSKDWNRAPREINDFQRMRSRLLKNLGR